jgi:hypothetical protein
MRAIRKREGLEHAPAVDVPAPLMSNPAPE